MTSDSNGLCEPIYFLLSWSDDTAMYTYNVLTYVRRYL